MPRCAVWPVRTGPDTSETRNLARATAAGFAARHAACRMRYAARLERVERAGSEASEPRATPIGWNAGI